MPTPPYSDSPGPPAAAPLGHPPRGPAPTSRLPLYLGIGALVAVLAALGLFLLRDSPSRVAKPSGYDSFSEREKLAWLYAEQADFDWQLQAERGCGLSGSDWHDDFDRHYQWALSVSEDAIFDKLKEREKQYDDCIN